MGLINNILKKLADITYPWPVGMVYPSTQLSAFTDINLRGANGTAVSRIDMSHARWTNIKTTTAGVWTKGASTTCTMNILRTPSSIMVRGTSLGISNVSRGSSVLVGVIGTSVNPRHTSNNHIWTLGYSDGGNCIFRIDAQNATAGSGTSVICTPIINRAHTTATYTFTDGQFTLVFYPRLREWVTNNLVSTSNTRLATYTKTGNKKL